MTVVVDASVLVSVLVSELAIDLRLRGADAVYVAVADQLSLPLVSWDVEQRERAAARVEVIVPT